MIQRYALMSATLLAGIAIGFGIAKMPSLTAHHASQPYAGQETRRISSLSAEDVAALKKGEGWGLAKPAELNGYPGPAHVLEFAEQLDLTKEQKQRVEASFEAMRAKAIELGKALVAAESALDEAFRSRKIKPDLLSTQLQAIARIRAALRAAHLNAHLEITPLLTEAQKKRYAGMRGYHAAHGGH